MIYVARLFIAPVVSALMPVLLMFGLASAAAGAISNGKPQYTREILNTPLPLCTVVEWPIKNRQRAGCGVIKNDRWLLAPSHHSVGRFYHGLARVRTRDNTPGKGLYGYVDGNGRWVVRPSFKSAGNFKHGIAAVTLPGGRRAVIDRSGKLVIPFTYTGAIILAPNLIAAQTRKKGHWGLIDRKGRWLQKERFKYSPNRLGESDYFSGQEQNGKSGAYDDSGKMVLKPVYYDVINASDDLFVASIKNNRYGMVDRHGKWVIPGKYYRLGAFIEGRAHAGLPNGTAGYLDKSGSWAIPPKFNFNYEFSDGIAQVEIKRGGESVSGYIDKHGKWLLPPKYAGASEFLRGRAAVSRAFREGYGLIERGGRYVAQPEFSRIAILSPHYAKAEYGGEGQDKKNGNVTKGMKASVYIDRNGQLYPSFMRDHFGNYKNWCYSFTRRPWDFPKTVDGFRVGTMCAGLFASWAGNGDGQTLLTVALLLANKKAERRTALTASAKKGHRRAQFELGRAYIHGNAKYGISKNPSKGNGWLKKAASQGEPNAQLLLGVNYGDGYGVSRDFNRSIALINQAIRNGRGNRDFTYMTLARNALAKVKRIRRASRGAGRTYRRSSGGTSLLDVYNRNISPYINHNQVRRDVARNKASAARQRQCKRAKSSCRETCYGRSDRGRSVWDARSPRKVCLSRCSKICR